MGDQVLKMWWEIWFGGEEGEMIHTQSNAPFTLFTLNPPNYKIITWSLLHLQNNIFMTVVSITDFLFFCSNLLDMHTVEKYKNININTSH